jgi:hypothetical protein
MLESIQQGEVIESPQDPIANFFYTGRAGFAFRRKDGKYIPLPSEGAVRQHLTVTGVARAETTAALCRIREENFVSYIGPLAGFPAGLHPSCDGWNLLVTSGPRIIESKPGDFDLIEGIFGGLFNQKESTEQADCVFSWLKHARKSVIEGRRHPLPALAMIGPRGAGKSLAIEIVNLCLGGRKAAAYRFLCGASAFNADCVGAELLIIDDDAASRDHRARTRLAQGIKKTLFGSAPSFEGKGKDQFTAEPVQNLIIAVNDEPEHVQVLPELDETMDDKIILTRTGTAKIPEHLVNDRKGLMAAIVAEIPSFCHWIETKQEREDAIDERGRLRCFRHPEILAMINSISPENRLAELVAQCWKIQDVIKVDGSWKGTAAVLESALLDSETTRHAARTLLSWSGATGAYLARLTESGAGFKKTGQRNGVMNYEIGI